jgi:hypothetical protein
VPEEDAFFRSGIGLPKVAGDNRGTSEDTKYGSARNSVNQTAGNLNTVVVTISFILSCSGKLLD